VLRKIIASAAFADVAMREILFVEDGCRVVIGDFPAPISYDSEKIEVFSKQQEFPTDEDRKKPYETLQPFHGGLCLLCSLPR